MTYNTTCIFRDQLEVPKPFDNTNTNEYNILIGAFIGDSKSKASKVLENAVGKCPIHNKKPAT